MYNFALKHNPMKRIFWFFIFLISGCLQLFSQNDTYSRVLIEANHDNIKKITELGIPLEGYYYGNGFVSELPAHDLDKLIKNGYTYTVLIHDVKAHYVQQNEVFLKNPGLLKLKSTSCQQRPYQTPLGFSLGSMGGFLTYDEMLAHLDSMRAHYPQLITQKQAVDTFNTIENRPVYWLRISNNADVLQNKPKVLYTALTHAREPAGMHQLIFFMYYLLENYNSHPDITNLLNNFELYFIPCVNPDGFIYNVTTDPQGGGMWRKNRRNNGSGEYGIDLNRNYGYMWGFDNQGSSPDPADDTYRGTAAFSEPETRLVKAFCQKFPFKTAINYHTYSNLFINPYNYAENVSTPDSLTFKAFAEVLTADNRYATGRGFDILGYLANGDAIDWMYGDQVTKPKIMAFTAEVGSPAYGFWPPMNEIENLCKDNMLQNIMLAYLAGKYAQVNDLSSQIVSVHQGFFKYSIKNIGIDPSASFTVSVVPVSSNILSVGAPKTYASLAHLQTATDSIAYTLAAGIASGDTIIYLLSVNNGSYAKADTVFKIFGNNVTLFSDNASGMSHWVSSSWGLDTDHYNTAPSSIADSPYGNYSESDNTDITTAQSVDLNNAHYAEVSFMTRFNIAAGYDYVQFLITADNGLTWTPLCGKYSVISGNSFIEGQPAYEGIQNDWVQEKINISEFIGNNVKFRFNLVSDWYPWTKPDGFYFDDFNVRIIDTTVISAQPEFLQEINNLYIYPNPVKDILSVALGNTTKKTLTIKIYNALGQKIFEKKSDVTKVNINTSDWPEGLYLISVSGAGGTNSKKFIINKNTF